MELTALRWTGLKTALTEGGVLLVNTAVHLTLLASYVTLVPQVLCKVTVHTVQCLLYALLFRGTCCYWFEGHKSHPHIYHFEVGCKYYIKHCASVYCKEHACMVYVLFKVYSEVHYKFSSGGV